MARLLLSFLVLTTILAADEKRYPIHLDRPYTAGQTYELRIYGSRKREEIIRTEETVRDRAIQSLSVEFESTVTVKAVDDRKRPIREVHEIQRFVRFEKDRPLPLLRPGTRVTVGLEGVKKRVRGDLPPEVRALLRVLLPLRGQGPSRDALFGSKRPRRIGESWAIDPEMMAVDLRSRGHRLEKETIRGTTTLVGLEKQKETPCLRIRSDVQITGLRPELPDSLTLETGRMKAQFQGDYPIGDERDRLLEEKTVIVSFLARGQKKADDTQIIVESMTGWHLELHRNFSTD